MDVVQKQKALLKTGICPCCRKRMLKVPATHFVTTGDKHRRWYAMYSRFMWFHLRGAVPPGFLHRYEIEHGMRELRERVYSRVSLNPWH